MEQGDEQVAQTRQHARWHQRVGWPAGPTVEFLQRLGLAVPGAGDAAAAAGLQGAGTEAGNRR
eukprot:9228270-Alexandrium_andersonii.AAC.1